MRYGNKLLATITIVTGTVITAMTAQTATAQQYYEPDANYPGQYTPDANARHNNAIYGEERRRTKRLRRQIRRERRARKRAARQRLYDVRQRENNKINQGGYDYYGNPVPRSAQRPVHRTRERVKLIYVPLPRAKPYRQPVVKVATTPTAPKLFVPTPDVAPEKAPEKTVAKKAVEIATLPKIEIETLPNPLAPKVFTPTTPKVTAPKVTTPKIAKPVVETKEIAEPAVPKVTTPKVVIPVKPEKKIKYTTFADTLRKIRERNNAKKQQVAKTLADEQPKTPTPIIAAPKVEKPTIAKPVVKIPTVTEPTIKKVEVEKIEVKKPEIKKIAALTPKVITKSTDEEPRPAANQISCSKAKKIITDYGFSDVTKITCKGKAYDFKAKRDGTPFKITLSSLSGELTKVLRQK